MKVHGGKIADRWSTLVNPGQPIVGQQLHGITDKDVKGAPAPAEAARQFLDWAGDATLVGHNVGFDLGFVEAALGDGTRIEQGRYLDTLTLAREAYPDQDVFKLADLTAFFGLEPRPTHRALPDAEATAELLLLLAKDLPVRVDAFKKAVAESIRARAKGDPAGRGGRGPREGRAGLAASASR